MIEIWFTTNVFYVKHEKKNLRSWGFFNDCYKIEIKSIDFPLDSANPLKTIYYPLVHISKIEVT